MVEPLFSRLTADQVRSFYGLVKFLRRLRVIGTLQAHTVSSSPICDPMDMFNVIDMTGADYCIIKDGYDPTRSIDVDELLESIFGRIQGPQYRSTP